MKKFAFMLALSCMLLALGCSSITPPTDVTQDPDFQKTLEGVPPMGCKVGVAPLVYAVQPPMEEEASGIIPYDFNKLYVEDLVTTLSNSKTYKQLREVESKEAKEYYTPEEFSLQEYIDRAKSTDMDMLLTFTVRNFKLHYRGTNGNHIGSIALWVSLWWPSWFIADENYGCDVVIEMNMYALKGREKVNEPIDTYTFNVKKDFELDDFQRGWQFWGILRVPGSLGEDNWKTVSDQITPHAINDLKRQLLTYTKDPEYQGRVARYIKKEKGKSMALIVGVDDYAKDSVGDLSYAENDAREVFNLVKASGEFDGGIEMLSGDKATLDNVKKSLGRVFSKQYSGRPKVFIYFAGHGVKTPDGPALALQDFDPAKPESALSLKELSKQFDAIPSDQLVFIADAGFETGKNCRGLGGKSSSSGEEILKTLASGPGRAILMAAGLDQPAAEYKGKKQGLFTYFLLDGLKKKPGASMNSLYGAMLGNVRRSAKILRVNQSPVQLGPGAGMPVLKR